VIEANSTRRQQILDYAAESGMNSGKARDIAAQTTRKAKTFTPETNLQKTWLQTSSALNFDGASLIKATLHKEQTSPQAPIITKELQQSLDLALNHLSRQQTKMNFAHVMTLAVGEFSKGHVHDMAALKLALNTRIEQGSVIPLSKEGHEFTTQAAIDKEQQLKALAQRKTKSLNTNLNDKALHQLNLNKDANK
ncbi:hypothetical protein C9J21_22565, partial [Photobacterium phosphoreum]|uniref:relaxase domain-containing protein n=1 Tax=Photobacterium phosphoreum TaxID=659 RepID=UPI000D40D8CF